MHTLRVNVTSASSKRVFLVHTLTNDRVYIEDYVDFTALLPSINQLVTRTSYSFAEPFVRFTTILPMFLRSYI